MTRFRLSRGTGEPENRGNSSVPGSPFPRFPGSLLIVLALFQSLELLAAEISNGWKRLPDLPDSIGVAGAFAGVSGGALIVAGGANFPDKPPWEGGKKVWYDTIWALEKPDGEWRVAGKLPKANAYGVSVTIPKGLESVAFESTPPKWQSTPDGLLCIGGGDAVSNFADVVLLQYAKGRISFQYWPSLPMPCANACGTLVDDEIIIAGGISAPSSTTALATSWSLRLVNPVSWMSSLNCPLFTARQLPLAGSIGNDFYVIGGTKLFAGTNGVPNRVYLRDSFRFATMVGIKDDLHIADLPFPLAASPSPAATVNGKLIVFGGDDAPSADPRTHKGFRDEMLAYDPATDKWSIIGRVPAPRVTAPVVFWNGGYVIVSGEIRRGVRSREVWMWTP